LLLLLAERKRSLACGVTTMSKKPKRSIPEPLTAPYDVAAVGGIETVTVVWSY
jgi:hypothetical protein